MKYLIKTYGIKRKAHLWNGIRTFCKLENSKVINNGYVISDNPNGQEICSICDSLRKKNRSPVRVIKQKPKSQTKVEYRNELVGRATVSEMLFKNILDRNGIKYEFQKIIDGYIVDFFIEPRLIIEIDGSVHNKKHVAENDAIRQANLERAGYVVMRFANSDADNEQKILERLRSP